MNKFAPAVREHHQGGDSSKPVLPTIKGIITQSSWFWQEMTKFKEDIFMSEDKQLSSEHDPTWQEVIGTVAGMAQNQNTATEIILDEQKRSKAKNMGLVCITVVATVSIVGLLLINHMNVREFVGFLSEYDFVTQDGEGQNYYNADIGGNVVNGAASNEEEEPQDGQGSGGSEGK